MTDTAPPEAPVPPTTAERSDDSRRRAIAGLLTGFGVLLVLIVAVQWATDSPDDSAGEPGEPFPVVGLRTLDGQPFSTAELEGQTTVVNFFASWCAPCRAEMPDFEEVWQRRGDDVAFVGININETSEDDARTLIAETGITYPVLLGASEGLLTDVRGLAMPTTVFVCADGTMANTHSGILTAEALETEIDEARC